MKDIGRRMLDRWHVSGPVTTRWGIRSSKLKQTVAETPSDEDWVLVLPLKG